VRMDQSPEPTMTMPAQRAFQPPPPPTLQMPVKPSMSTVKALTLVFFAPGWVFDSFRDLTTFGPAAVRFLIAAPIIVVAIVGYSVLYLQQIGPERIARGAMEASSQFARMPAEQKERALQMQENPTFKAITWAMGFGRLLLPLLLSFFLGALIYWLGSLIFNRTFKYMQALLVWTYAALPATVLWALANTLVLLIRPPTTNIAIATGSAGVIHANLGAVFDVTAFPIPVYVAALSELDLFAFYGLALAMFGLRKVARIPWLGSIGIVVFVWLVGVVWRIGWAGLADVIMK
jgi:hypothetical protein